MVRTKKEYVIFDDAEGKLVLDESGAIIGFWTRDDAWQHAEENNIVDYSLLDDVFGGRKGCRCDGN